MRKGKSHHLVLDSGKRALALAFRGKVPHSHSQRRPREKPPHNHFCQRRRSQCHLGRRVRRARLLRHSRKPLDLGRRLPRRIYVRVRPSSHPYRQSLLLLLHCQKIPPRPHLTHRRPRPCRRVRNRKRTGRPNRTRLHLPPRHRTGHPGGTRLTVSGMGMRGTIVPVVPAALIVRTAKEDPTEADPKQRILHPHIRLPRCKRLLSMALRRITITPPTPRIGIVKAQVQEVSMGLVIRRI